MAGRKPGFRMTDEHRSKIANSQILNALMEHVEGKREMSSTQVSAGIALLRKVLPDLSATQHSGDEENPIHHKIETDAANFGRAIGALEDIAGTRAGNAGGKGGVAEGGEAGADNPKG